MKKILLIEDNNELRENTAEILELASYEVISAKDGKEGVARAYEIKPDLILCDIMMPVLDGIQTLKQLRADGNTTPVLLLTAKDSLQDKVSGLNTGADDYLVKPFHPVELNARVQALMRRPQSYAGKVLTVRDIELDTEACRVFRASQEVDLTSKEFSLLELLMRYPNQSFTLETILSRVWQSDSSASVDTVRTHMKTLRRKLGDSEENGIIRTKRGAGYRIVDQ